jgi:hypothetical protein
VTSVGTNVEAVGSSVSTDGDELGTFVELSGLALEGKSLTIVDWPLVAVWVTRVVSSLANVEPIVLEAGFSVTTAVEDGPSLISVLSVPDGDEDGILVELSGLELEGNSVTIVVCSGVTLSDVCVANELRNLLIFKL